MICSINYKVWILITSAILILTFNHGAFSESAKERLYVNSNGLLIINGQQKWRRSIFKEIGYTFYKDDKVYETEGVLSKKSNDYDEAILDSGKALLYFEIRDGRIYRGVLVSGLIPVVVGVESHRIRIGTKLSKLVGVLGKYEMLSGDSPGMNFIFKEVNKVSFHTECNFYPEELTEKQKKMTRNELFSECRIDSILFFGNEGQIWK